MACVSDTSISPRQMGQRQRRERERLHRAQYQSSSPSSSTASHGHTVLTITHVPPTVVDHPYRRPQRTPSPPATRRSPSGRVPFDSPGTTPSSSRTASLLSDLSPRQLCQRRRKECHRLRCRHTPTCHSPSCHVGLDSAVSPTPSSSTQSPPSAQLAQIILDVPASLLSDLSPRQLCQRWRKDQQCLRCGRTPLPLPSHPATCSFSSCPVANNSAASPTPSLPTQSPVHVRKQSKAKPIR
jgi:hypothetical protein